MKQGYKTRRRSEEGIALLIAIFVLLLISVVAIALLVSSGTETALGANYRSSSTVYYAALAGLEEARGRLLPKNPNYFGTSVIPNPMPLGQTVYLINRLPGETITPWDSSDKYYDKEYQSEFGVPASSASWQSRNSVWDNNVQGIPGPLFKWVRVNAVTEQSLYIDVDYSSSYDSSTLIYYDPAHLDSGGNPWPSLIVNPSPPATAVQVLEITALAYLPNGSQKYLQYLVAPVKSGIAFPAALTLDGVSDAYAGPDHNNFQVLGASDPGDSACGTPSTPYPVYGVGVPDASDVATVIAGIPAGQGGKYQGSGGSTPNVMQVTLPPNLQTVQSLDKLVQGIIQNADAVITGPANQSNLPSTMSATNPMTVAIVGDPTVPSQGNFSLGAGFTGYGLLLVTGDFTYDPGSFWNGIILVIGQGSVTKIPGGSGGLFSGAMLIAQTRDSSGNLLPGPNPGPATFNDTGTGGVGQGIFYNCSAILAAEAPSTYKVLSFHEIQK
jgi:hypothetical protein